MAHDQNKDITPPVIDWRITSACNYHCPFCYASDKLKEMNDRGIGIVINKIVSSGCRIVCITGGEPLCSSHTIDVIKELHRHQISVFLATNGTYYLEQRKEIDPYITKLALPLEGYDEESNQLGGRDIHGFETVINILESFKEKKPEFVIQIGTVLTRKNLSYNYFQQMDSLLSRYSIDIWKIYEMIPEGRGIENEKELLLKDAKLNGFKKFIEEISEKRGRTIQFMERRIRNAAYFIIRPDGKVMVPIDHGVITEYVIGDLLVEDMDAIVSRYCQIMIFSNLLEVSDRRIYTNFDVSRR